MTGLPSVTAAGLDTVLPALFDCWRIVIGNEVCVYRCVVSGWAVSASVVPRPSVLCGLQYFSYFCRMSARQLLVLGFLLPVLAGCSSFHREWRTAAKQPPPAHDIAGCWEGTWQNTNNTHQDRMRAILTRISDVEYRGFFHARYKKIFSFSYHATLRGTWSGEEFQFRGEENLGMLAGGFYKYDGRVSPTRFFSTYDSKYDVGTFRMSRPSK